ncbi:MAG: sarcosine oxidase subunit gamma [Devosia sp.]
MPDLSTSRAASLPAALLATTTGVTAAPPLARFILRGIDAVAPAGDVLGLTIPTKPLTSASAGERGALWLGPDEFLLLAPAAETATLQAQLTTALAGTACALVDVSHRQTALLLDGPAAASMLNSGVPLDLSLAAFPVGMVARTIFDKAEIVLWRRDTNSFHLEVWRSFAPYVLALLNHAAPTAR